MKYCARCKTEKPVSEFFKNSRRADGLQVYCKICLYEYRKETDAGKRWYERHAERERQKARQRFYANPEATKDRRRTYYAANRDKLRTYESEKNRRIKMAAFEAYGGAICSCCGESNPYFLSIDHIVPVGKNREGAGSRMYRWLLSNNYPEGFRVLCFNCNLGRNVVRGECPHTLTAS